MRPEEAVEFHPGATRDISELWQYIASDNPEAAGRFIEEIIGVVEKLVDFPMLGHLRSDLSSRDVRFITKREYLIAYAPNEQPLLVIAVFHGRRNPRVIASMLRRRN